MRIAFFFILLALPLLVAGSVKKCYTYASTQNHKADTKTQGTCSSNTNFCVKYIADNPITGQVYGRDCAYNNICQRDGCFNAVGSSVCCCSKNLCNSSSLTTGISSIVVLLSYFLFRS